MKYKPHKWGYKLFVLSSEMGFAHKVEIYSGQENEPKFCPDYEPDIGASGNVVIRLGREIPKFQNFKLYFDRCYTSIDLALFLAKNGIQCVGTVQRNRLPKCKFPADNEMEKEKRGFSQEYYANVDSVEISTVTYKDNSRPNVVLLSTFVGEEHKKVRQNEERTCTSALSSHCVCHTGNVDLLDTNIGRFRIRMKMVFSLVLPFG